MVAGTIAVAHGEALAALDPVSEFKAKHKEMVTDAITFLREYAQNPSETAWDSKERKKFWDIAEHFLSADNAVLEGYHHGALYTLSKIVYGLRTLITAGKDPEDLIAIMEDGLTAAERNTPCRTLDRVSNELDKIHQQELEQARGKR